MRRALAIAGILLTLLSHPAKATVEFDFVQTASTAPLAFQYVIGFDDSAATSGYSINLGYNRLPYNVPLGFDSIDFGALDYMQFRVLGQPVTINLSSLLVPTTCQYCIMNYMWSLSIDWAGAGSLPNINWYFNDTNRDVSIWSNAGALFGWYNNDCCVVPCNATGACTFSGDLVQADEPHQTLWFVTLGLGMLAWLTGLRGPRGRWPASPRTVVDLSPLDHIRSVP